MDFSKKDTSSCNNDGDICTPVPLLQKLTKSDTNDKIKLVELLKRNTNCKTEVCAVYHSTKSEAILANYFKPIGPRNTNDLLSNHNIDIVLNNWSKQYSLTHIPYQMRDFASFSNSKLMQYVHDCEFKNTDYMACVLNTDYAAGSGIHWVCLFVDYTSNPVTIEYFNSAGNKPLYEFQLYMNLLEHTLKKNNIDAKSIYVSSIEHQKGDTECGVYCLYYIYSRINNISYKAFNSNKLFSDDLMTRFRKVLFTSEADLNK